MPPDDDGDHDESKMEGKSNVSTLWVSASVIVKGKSKPREKNNAQRLGTYDAYTDFSKHIARTLSISINRHRINSRVLLCILRVNIP